MVQNNPSWSNQVISEEAYLVKNHMHKLFGNKETPHISFEEFFKIAEENAVSKDQIGGMLEDLHTLGVCFWYKRNELTNFNTLVINPDWIINAIYRIINTAFKQNKHMITISDGTKILENDEQYDYPYDKIRFVFHLMREYELAFFKTDDSIFIPGILPIDEPDNLPDFPINDRLKMRFDVEKVLPPNICTRIVVHRSEHGEIVDENLLWRKGVVLESKKYNATALVVETEKSITISVKGEKKSQFLADLRETLRNIFDSYKTLYPDLKYEVLEPVHSKATTNRDLTVREEPLLLSEIQIKEYIEKNLRYYDFVNGRFISLNKTGEHYQISLKRKFPFLFITANENEKNAFETKFVRRDVNFVKGAQYAYGDFGNYTVAWFHMLSQGVSNPDATILCGDIIEEISPVAVIMVGIAFGANESTQKIGDVLVSKSILNYDSRKEREGVSQYKENPKEVGFQLFNAFSSFSSSGHLVWNYPSGVEGNKRFRIIEGAILTGSVLIDDYNFRKKLLTDFQDHNPIGGEMESYGIYAQCRSKGVAEWIIVKAICDWGYNKQNPEKDKWQKIAADSAVSYCHSIFSLRGGDGRGIFDDLIN
ncbi:MAG: hypothetical protein GX905_08110 [Bacteroidales bacterium]|nr:hypothetical protein [Bacteroidales bacterium]